MSILKIKIKGKVFITFGSASLSFQREVSDTKYTSISYNNATGQSLNAGQVLYSTGTSGNVGYLSVKSKDTIVLSGSGNLPLSVDHYPSAEQGNRTVEFFYDSSVVSLNLVYNSNPNTSDVIVETDNRTPYTFKVADFTGHYTDYDSDAISQIALFGNVSGFTVSGVPYVSGTYIPITDVTQLIYTPLDQNDPYEKDVTWKAKDSNGNISN